MPRDVFVTAECLCVGEPECRLRLCVWVSLCLAGVVSCCPGCCEVDVSVLRSSMLRVLRMRRALRMPRACIFPRAVVTSSLVIPYAFRTDFDE